MCVCARPVRCSVCTSSRVLWVASGWTRKETLKKYQDGGQVFWFLSITTSDCSFLKPCPQFPETTSFWTWVDVVVHHCSGHLSSCQLLMPFLQVGKPRMWAPPGCWRPMGRGRWGWRFTFFCAVLSPISASHSWYPCSEGSSWLCKRCLSLFVIIWIPNSCRVCFCISTNAFFASWYPGFCCGGGACLSSSTPRK